MNKLSPREVLADLLTSGDFLVEITADADRVAQIIIDWLEDAGFKIVPAD